ncbi:uncharacterized protein L3040_004886 [Drepanopeziza brunnea f. sp. 'multigermtubi']|uniref:Uncharacterized protein n=1 Tax=Marssonina brunnea f. sp. multigermtubi (strain MB_m1) TaxID=1072389 RepID=K1XME1_MARBU|nr:uncharacterized protein MBM_00776 [Drepanopeziza brunnea f. sp. 'multigermtubi' MB_m1]EKD21663.1 hypothetical protein MBM_00776 [Drepanopeziza brunnea f. sp. 'multigermtubi' MB_m1]KAJ5042334.1 hypothetical protein L3040_004886 [Drepanopeziza brunnea f. sp. 'multigermtubi']
MPRTLPWLKGSNTTTIAPPKAGTPAQKPKRRVKDLEKADYDGEDSKTYSKKIAKNKAEVPPSSSPPPSPPEESFMEEGRDKDDRYRMVEDELFKIAQTYTVHLHTAEYKRLQKAVKSENADTINSISRPVTGKMTDHAKRKSEAVAIAKKQRATIEGLNGKKGGNFSDDSQDEGLPYVGTTLHGLMDSPRKKAASLAKLGTKATTRAAAGFGKASFQAKPDRQSSPLPKHATQKALELPQNHVSTDNTEEEDDDLDAPIAAPKLIAKNQKSTLCPISRSKSIPTPSAVVRREPRPFTSFEQKSQSNPMKTESESKYPIKVESPPMATAPKVSTPNVTGKPTRLSRLERMRQNRAKKQEEPDLKKEYDYDAIPTF